MAEQAPEKQVKKPRRPVGLRNKLEVLNKDPDRVYRLINAEPARIAEFEEAAYRFEDTAKLMPYARKGTKGASIENAFHAGGGQQQVLVSIDKETFEEDQRLKQARVDATEAGMKTKSAEGLQEFYGEIKISR